MIYEPTENFLVNLSNASNASIADSQGVGTITNDDPQPMLFINDVTQLEGNAGTTNFVFTVGLSTASWQTVTVAFASANGTALAPGDYSANIGTLTFNPGETSKTVTISVVGETAFEANETFVVNLSNAVGATLADGQGLGTIQNDDVQPPSLSINDVMMMEGQSGITYFTFTVSLSWASAQVVTCNFATADGTATVIGNDYYANSGMLTFNPGELQKTITVQVQGNTTPEPTEGFFVNLSATVNAWLNDAQGIGTIMNDDP